MSTLADLIVLGIIFFPFWLIARNGYRRIHGPTSAERRTAEQRAKGVAGEQAVADRLHKTLSAMCGQDYAIRNSVILNHAPGSAFPTAEVDHLVIAPFGVFVIETKNWSGRIEPGEADMLVRIARDGRRENRKNPASQNASKVTFVKSILPGHASQVYGLGVFSDHETELDIRLKSNLVTLRDIDYWLRARRDVAAQSRVPAINVQEALATILVNTDTSDDATEKHRKRVSAIA